MRRSPNEFYQQTFGMPSLDYQVTSADPGVIRCSSAVGDCAFH